MTKEAKADEGKSEAAADAVYDTCFKQAVEFRNQLILTHDARFVMRALLEIVADLGAKIIAAKTLPPNVVARTFSEALIYAVTEKVPAPKVLYQTADGKVTGQSDRKQ